MKQVLWRSPALVAFVVLALACGGAGSEVKAQEPPKSAIVLAVQKTRPSIVAIRVPKTQQKRDTVGTGVIIHQDGYVITNRHVVGSLKAVYVRLFDGNEYVGQVICTDPSGDLAILKMHAPGTKFKTLPLDPMRPLWEGEEVIAIGHPYGYSYTVSRGIVGALGREITMPTGEVLDELIQHDAAINPGNSGGPLINTQGQLVGINVALREGAQGIAFAINVGKVREFVSRSLGANWLAAMESPKAPVAQSPPSQPAPQKVAGTPPANAAKVQAVKKEQPPVAEPVATESAIKASPKTEVTPEPKAEPRAETKTETRQETPAPAPTVPSNRQTQENTTPVPASVTMIESGSDPAGRILTWLIAGLLTVVAGQQYLILRRGSRRSAFAAN